jgi:hypothetical protein
MSLLFATAMLVFLRAIQQLNVVGGHYLLAGITSYAIAAAEIGVIIGIVAHQWDAVIYVGTGGAIGVTSAMIFHKTFIRRNKK